MAEKLVNAYCEVRNLQATQELSQCASRELNKFICDMIKPAVVRVVAQQRNTIRVCDLHFATGRDNQSENKHKILDREFVLSYIRQFVCDTFTNLKKIIECRETIFHLDNQCFMTMHSAIEDKLHDLLNA